MTTITRKTFKPYTKLQAKPDTKTTSHDDRPVDAMGVPIRRKPGPKPKVKLNVTPFEAGAQIIEERVQAEAQAEEQVAAEAIEAADISGQPESAEVIVVADPVAVDRVISMADFRASTVEPDIEDAIEPEEGDAPSETVEELQDRLEKSREKPAVEALPALESASFEVKRLRAALLVAPTKDVRYYLNSVFIHRAGQGVRIVTSDGHRLLAQDVSPEDKPAWLNEEGVKLTASELSSALAVCAKHGESVRIEWGVGHTHAVIHAADGFYTFRVAVVDGKFPDYARILADVDLSNQGGDAMAAAQIDPTFVRGAADVAKALGCKALQSFTGSETKASAFLFGGADALMVVMPLRGQDGATRIVTARTVALIGGGLASSVGALRAHLTRTTNDLAKTQDPGERTKLDDRRSGLQERIDAILRMSREALPAPVKAAA